MATEDTPEKQNGGLWKPGQSGNPAGRPKGARNKLGEEFIQSLYADYQTHGAQVIERVREERPHEYLKVVASLLPKQLEIKEAPFDGISDEELAALIVAARAALGLAEGVDGREWVPTKRPQRQRGAPVPLDAAAVMAGAA
jgi:hypothetical protein